MAESKKIDVRHDIILAGGGLASGLIALALARLRPELDVAIVEAGDSFGGNHIWSFFDGDIAPDERWLVEPLTAARWPDYQVRFPDHKRLLATPYNSCESSRLDNALRQCLPSERLLSGRRIRAVEPRAVVLEDGSTLDAKAVIDARGPADLSKLMVGWQKFVGLELETEAPHGVPRPVIMDATVDQVDGYRFVYLLPLSPTLLLVEDTYYSDTPELEVAAVEARITAYAHHRLSLPAYRVQRRGTGVLPVVIGGNFEAYWRSGGEGVAKAGLRAGLFHPTTGYSLPDAVRTARAVVRAKDISAEGLHASLHRHARNTWRQRGFYRMLNRMLFRAAPPHLRYQILEYFYRLDPGLIERFYAARTTRRDQFRLLSGRPPVSIGAALIALFVSPTMEHTG